MKKKNLDATFKAFKRHPIQNSGLLFSGIYIGQIIIRIIIK